MRKRGVAHQIETANSLVSLILPGTYRSMLRCGAIFLMHCIPSGA